MFFTEKDIKKITFINDYKRGLEYYNNDNVLWYEEIEESETSLTLISEVRGSGRGTYTQEISLEISEDDGQVELSGECSCPVGHNCKHTIAVCLEYINENINTTNNPSYELDEWLQNMAQPKTEKEATINDEYFLTYRIFDAQYDYKLSLFKSKILKNGNIGRGLFIDLHRLNYSYKTYFSSISDDDKYILRMIQTLKENEYASGLNNISGELGYLLIKKLVKTNRFFYKDNDKPIKLLNEKIKPKITFTKNEEGYEIDINIDFFDNEILETEPPYILDTKRNFIYELDLKKDTLKMLLKAPIIPKENIGKVYRTIAKKFDDLDLEIPDIVKIENIKTEPIPQIHLQYNMENDEKNFTSFKIDFKYQDYIVKFYPQRIIESFYFENLKIDIVRNLEFENSIKNRIENLGFKIGNNKNNLNVVFKKKNRQEQIKLWKDLILNKIPQFEKEGWNIFYDENFNMKFETDSEVTVDTEENNGWFNLSFNLEFNGVSQPIAPLVSTILEEFENYENMPKILNLEIEENHFVEIESKKIKPIIKTIIELMDRQDNSGELRIAPFDAHLIEDFEGNIIWKGNKELLELSKKLKNFNGIEKVTPPKALKADLRDYQKEGLNWLNFLHEFKFSGILADDMGLGKTIQTLAHLSRLKEEKILNKPSLIVVPTSLVANWKNETHKFTPNLSFLILHGNERKEKFKDIENSDIVITTYALILRDVETLEKKDFYYIILDEAQKIKNPTTKAYSAIRSLKSEHRLALTGTPIENHLGELWSIFNFLMNGFLDNLRFFKKFYQVPIEKEKDAERERLLNKKIKPFMIRRTKERVVNELPKKTEIIKTTQFDKEQARLYESVRVIMDKKVKEAISKKGIGSSQIMILDALLKLRQVCCDPSLMKIDEAKKVKKSAKLELFLDLVDELLLEGRKILVFSQFTSMLSILETEIKKRKYSYSKLTGKTRKREEVIEKFTKGDASIFLISLKAGGVGLNLVEADTVIHYDPWWNPAVENQATDRAYRIGQDKAVFVYKLIVENTIEEKILELQKNKERIQNSIYEKDGQKDNLKFGSDELMELLK